MKRWQNILLIVLSYTASATAQLTLIDTRFLVLANNGTDYDVKVQIKTNSDLAKIGTSNLVFRFDHTALTYPTNPAQITDYEYNPTFNNGLVYTSHVTHNTRGNGIHEISLNIVYNPGASGFGTVVGKSWVDLVSIYFSTQNVNGASNLQWDTASYYSPVYGDTTTLAPGHWWFKGSWNDLNTSPLPVELISFSAYNRDDHVHLHWETATELNNYGFEVQRMEEGRDWETVAFVPGHGTVHYPQIYDYDDPLAGLAIPIAQQQSLSYRLRQVDRDGTFEYSPVVDVAFRSVPERLSVEVYPNPSTDRAAVSLHIEEESAVDIAAYDMTGREVLQLASGQLLGRGSHAFEIPTHALAEGVYALRVRAGNGIRTRMIVVRK
jgi:hypothetical protein